MVSKTAVETLEDLRREGLEPSFADVIRLNALGLRLEAARKRCAATSVHHLPRVAAVTETLAFRQPTVGHEIWLDRVERLIPPDDFQSALAVKAFALSRPCADLPDPDDPRVIRQAVAAFCEECRDLTRDQIFAAIEYVIFGSDATRGERPPAPTTDEDADDGDSADWDSCLALGVLNKGRAVLWGLDAAEMAAMPRRQLEDVIRHACVYHGLGADADEDRRAGEFYAAMDEIAARLRKEIAAHG